MRPALRTRALALTLLTSLALLTVLSTGFLWPLAWPAAFALLCTAEAARRHRRTASEPDLPDLDIDRVRLQWGCRMYFRDGSSVVHVLGSEVITRQQAVEQTAIGEDTVVRTVSLSGWGTVTTDQPGSGSSRRIGVLVV